jgi:uncharacterized membrane protein
VLWIALAVLMFITIIGLPFALVLIAIAGLWVAYRVVRGWWTLIRRGTLPA